MSAVDLDIVTLRKKDQESVVRLVESVPGDWRVYKWEDGQLRNWSVTVGRRFGSRFDALKFLRGKGFVIDETQYGG